VLDMSHRTTAAVRQCEMKVNITLLTMSTLAGRLKPRATPDGAAGFSALDMEEHSSTG
jgi:hypothetical protein